MAEFPVLPLWTDILLGDTQHLTAAEFGAYLLMLIIAWRSKECALPNDDKYLSRITRAGRNWRRIKATVLPYWTVGGDGQLRQRRLTEVHLREAEKRSLAVAAGNASALKRQKLRSASVERTLNGRTNGTATTLSVSDKDSPSLRSGEATTAENQLNGANGHAKRERGTRLPPDWVPSADALKFADDLGLDGFAIADKFRDYWHGAAGSKGIKLSWDATWRNWCRREAEQRPRSLQRNGPATGIAQGFADALKQFRESDDDSGGDFPPDVPLLGRQ